MMKVNPKLETAAVAAPNSKSAPDYHLIESLGRGERGTAAALCARSEEKSVGSLSWGRFSSPVLMSGGKSLSHSVCVSESVSSTYNLSDCNKISRM